MGLGELLDQVAHELDVEGLVAAHDEVTERADAPIIQQQDLDRFIK